MIDLLTPTTPYRKTIPPPAHWYEWPFYSLVLVFWLLVRPSAWKKCIAEIDPDLPPDFSIIHLNRSHWKNPSIRRLLGEILVMLPLFASLISSLVGLIRGLGTDQLTIAAGTSLGYALAGALSLSTVVSLGTGAIFGFVVGLGSGLMAGDSTNVAFLYATTAGLTGCVGLNLSRTSYRQPFLRQLSGLVTGLFISTLIITAGSILASGAAFGFQDSPQIGSPISINEALLYALSGAVFEGSLYLITLWMRRNRLTSNVVYTALIAGTFGGIIYLYFLITHAQNPILFFASGLGGGLFFTVLFGLVWNSIDKIAGRFTAAITAAIVTNSIWVPLAPYIVFEYQPDTSKMIIAGFVMFATLSYSYWHSFITYPFLIGWVNFLYELDRRSVPQSPLRYFHLHPVFWDDFQPLSWIGLDDYLLLLAERDPQALEPTLLYLTQRNQHKTVLSVQIELAARELDRCQDIQAISQAYKNSISGTLQGTYSIILRSFAQISQDTESALRQTSAHHARISLGMIQKQLTNLQRELMLSAEPHTTRFAQTANAWHTILTNYSLSLAQRSRHRQEIENPYICGIPLNSQQQIFVGRTDIMARLEHSLLSGNRPPILLYGQRRMGKTSLLLNLSNYLPSSIVVCFVDGQSLAGIKDLEEFLTRISARISQSAADQRNIAIPAIPSSPNLGSLFMRINQWLDTCEKIFNQHESLLLLAIDEFETMRYITQPSLAQAKDLLSLSRHIIQHRPFFKIVLAGSRSLDELRGLSNFLINVQVEKVEYLHTTDALRLIEQPIQNFPLVYEPDASQRILHLTRCHPHLVQLLCYEIVIHKNEQDESQRYQATTVDVEQAATQALQSGSFFFFDIVNSQIPTGSAKMLAHLARLGENHAISCDDWRGKFPEYFEQNLTALLRRDLVELSPQGYRFQIELVRRWFSQF